MLPDDRHALYGDNRYLTAAVLYDRDWVVEQAREAGLTIFDATAAGDPRLPVVAADGAGRRRPSRRGVSPDDAPYGTPTR